jgi:uncharacterized protein (DUF111 family)
LSSSDEIWVLETNLDDASGELVGYCISQLWDAGALDVYTIAIQMKKNRPGILLSVLCQQQDLERMEAILFRETTTLGVRRWAARRHKMQRKPHAVATPWGAVEGKLGWLPGQPASFSPEFESCRQIAQQHGIPLKEVYEAAQKSFERPGEPG